MKTFSNYYYTEETDLHLLSEKMFKSRYAANIFNKIFGNKNRRINPKDYKNTEEVSQKGFFELFDKLAYEITNQRKNKKKHFIVDRYNGIVKIKDFPDNFPAIDKIEDVSVFKTSKGGSIVMYYLKDDENDDRMFVAVDDKGNQFFSDTLGMPLKIFQQKSKAGGLWSSQIKGDVQSKQPKIQSVEIDKAEFDKLVPTESVNITKNVLTEEGRPLVWDKEKRIWKAQTGQKVVPKPEDYAINPKTGSDKDSIAKTLQKELDAYRNKMKKVEPTAKETEPSEPPKAEPKPSFVRKDEPKAVPVPPKVEPKKEKSKGDLYIKINKDLKQEPTKIKPTTSIETGWSYYLKNGGQIFIYKLKDGSYKIAYDKKGKDVLSKFDIINPEEIETLK